MTHHHHDDIEIIGKNVKDMYGTFMGKVAGTITDIDGSIQSVGVDYGAQGLQQIQYEQLVVQKDVVIYIPKWRLDSQRLIREKQLTLRRLRALIDIVSENDDMKSDAEIIHQKYKSKLVELDETEGKIKARLEVRLAELDEQIKSAKMLVFDAKVQFKSNEIPQATFETVKSCTNEVIEHVNHEVAEIASVKGRIADLELEIQELTCPPQQDIQESAVSYLEATEPQQQQQAVQAILPEAPTEPIAPAIPAGPIEAKAVSPHSMSEPSPQSESEAAFAFPEPPQQMTATTPTTPTTPTTTTPEIAKDDSDNDWLARMEAQ